MRDSDKYITELGPWLVGKQSSNGEWRAYCPIHEDPKGSKSSSAMINFKMGVWNCNSARCGEHGTVKQLIRALKNRNVIDLKTRKRVDDTTPEKPLPSERDIRLWTKTLLSRERAYKIMTEDRGLTRSLIREWGIGFDGQRFTIPIRDEHGELKNVRRYKPGRKVQNKMISWGTGWGEGRLMGWDALLDESIEDVVLAAGELDMLIGRAHNLPTVTSTSGEGVWKPEWSEHFRGKRVYICYDDDKSGKMGGTKVASQLKGIAKGIYRVTLNTGINGGDLTDYFTTIGSTESDFLVLMKEAQTLWEDEGDHVIPTVGHKVSVEESQSTEYKGPIELTVMVSGKMTPAFLAPKVLEANCAFGAPDNQCAACPLMVSEGHKELHIPADDERLLSYVDTTDGQKHELGRRIMGTKCSRHVTFDMRERYTIEELQVQPSIEHRTEDTETPISRRVLNVGTYKTPVNQLARIVGKQVADPRTQRGVIQGWHLEAVNSDIDSFKMTPQVYKRLLKFRPNKSRKQSVMDKCSEIARDVSKNATGIYGREMLHIAYDLVWHSAIKFEFAGEEVTKGWLECLIVGDTRTGKSETANRMKQHYQSGVIRSCEGASLAGLVGGATQTQGKSWMVTWGVIPLNDRRLVVLDEMSGLMNNKESKGIIESMSSIRSEGRAEITKIKAEETSARTRLIWITNPVGGAKLGTGFGGEGMAALKALVQNPEDIARYDFVMAVANDEVDSKVINSLHKTTRPKFSSDDCAMLVMWAWSRRSDQIKWSSAAEQAVLDAAEELGDRYVPDPPLIQAENVRVKLARLAVAFAARTFSTGNKGEHILVRQAHVRAAVEFLDTVYGNHAMGYRDASEKSIKENQAAVDNVPQCRKFLKNSPEVLHVLRSVGASTFRNRDFEEQGALTRDEANEAVKRLTSMNMIERIRNGRGALRMRPVLAKLLKEMGDE